MLEDITRREPRSRFSVSRCGLHVYINTTDQGVREGSERAFFRLLIAPYVDEHTCRSGLQHIYQRCDYIWMGKCKRIEKFYSVGSCGLLISIADLFVVAKNP